MSKVKKILAMLMEVVMTLGMCVTAFASGISDTAASIKNISFEGKTSDGKDKITVTAYQIISYDIAGTYSPVISGTISEVDGKLSVTAANLEDLYKNHLSDLKTVNHDFTRVGETDEFRCNTLDYGTWMIVITGSEKYLYNPAVISVWKGTDGNKKYGTMDLVSDQWMEENVYAKKSEPTIKKEVLTENVKGVQYGDVLQFQVTADVPSYMSNKVIETYSISDELTGLELVTDEKHAPEATVGNALNEELTGKVNAAIQAGSKSFTVSSFSNDFMKTNAGKQIVIKYWARVSSNAEINVDKLNNKATLVYDTNGGPHTKYAETKHYTFGIDTDITGGNIEGNKTGEFIKVDADGTVRYHETNNTPVVENGLALNGAQFQLHIGTEDGTLFEDADRNKTFTTVDGKLEINGLDSDINYYLIETKAPDGYTLNATPIQVKINASIDEKGNLTGYQVVMTVKDEDGNYTIPSSTTNYGYKMEDGETTLINDEEHPSNPLGFQNTTLQSLPSTGGIGTTIFTIGGCAIMVTAAGLYFATRKKTEK